MSISRLFLGLIPVLGAMSVSSSAASFVFTDTFDNLTPGTVYQGGDTFNGWTVSGDGSVIVRDDFSRVGHAPFLELWDATISREFVVTDSSTTRLYLWDSGNPASVTDLTYNVRDELGSFGGVFGTLPVELLWQEGGGFRRLTGTVVRLTISGTGTNGGPFVDDVLVAIPEPGTYAASFAFGLGAWAWTRRQRRPSLP